MIQRRIVLAVSFFIFVGRSLFLHAGSAVRLLVAPVSGSNALMVIQQASNTSLGAIQKMREEKLKDMNNLLFERMYVELGKYTFEETEETFTDSYYQAVGIDFLQESIDISPYLPEQIERDRREYFEILKAYCNSSSSRDYENEKKL